MALDANGRSAGEVLHVKIDSDPERAVAGRVAAAHGVPFGWVTSCRGKALSEALVDMPFASQVVPMPEQSEWTTRCLPDRSAGSGPRAASRVRSPFRLPVGRLRIGGLEAIGSYSRSGQGRPDRSPDRRENLIALAYGVLPGLLNGAATGPMVRECERYLMQFVLQPIAELVAEEATQKLGETVTIDTMRPTQVSMQAARARAVNALVAAMVGGEGGRGSILPCWQRPSGRWIGRRS